MHRTPRRRETRPSVQAGTVATRVTDHERKAVAARVPYSQILDRINHTAELQGHVTKTPGCYPYSAARDLSRRARGFSPRGGMLGADRAGKPETDVPHLSRWSLSDRQTTDGAGARRKGRSCPDLTPRCPRLNSTVSYFSIRSPSARGLDLAQDRPRLKSDMVAFDFGVDLFSQRP
jgi:hypothetical protein